MAEDKAANRMVRAGEDVVTAVADAAVTEVAIWLQQTRTAADDNVARMLVIGVLLTAADRLSGGAPGSTPETIAAYNALVGRIDPDAEAKPPRPH